MLPIDNGFQEAVAIVADDALSAARLSEALGYDVRYRGPVAEGALTLLGMGPGYRATETLIGHPDLRIVGRGADWPHMSLRYTITEGDKVVKSGEERLSSMSYMERYPFSRYRDEPLRYEEQMIDEWFKEKVALR